MIDILKNFWGLLLLGLILRLVVAGLTFHPDVTTPALASAVVFKEVTLDFYGKSSKIAPGEVLDDLPLSYLISLPFHLSLRPFVSDNIESAFFLNRSSLFGQPSFWFYLIYAKFPLIIFDLLLGTLLATTFLAHQKKLLFFWIFNPITLWATAAIGQVDIYPTFFIVLAYFFAKRNNLNWAALALGAGGAIKSAPFLLVPLLLGICKSWKQRLTVLLLASVPYLVTVIPYLTSPEFKANALFTPQLSKMFYATNPLSGAESIFIVPALILFLYLLFFSKKRDSSNFLKFAVAIILGILIFTHFHMQWFLWVMPLLLIWLMDQREKINRLVVSGVFIGWILMLFLFDSSLQLKLFAPVFPELDQMKGLAENLSSSKLYFWRSFAASIFAGSGIFLIWRILKQ